MCAVPLCCAALGRPCCLPLWAEQVGRTSYLLLLQLCSARPDGAMPCFWPGDLTARSRLSRLSCRASTADHHAVRYVLGDRWGRGIAATQLLSCVLGTTTYSLAGSNAMVQFVRGVGGSAPTKQWEWLLILGGVQVMLSQASPLALHRCLGGQGMAGTPAAACGLAASHACMRGHLWLSSQSVHGRPCLLGRRVAAAG